MNDAAVVTAPPLLSRPEEVAADRVTEVSRVDARSVHGEGIEDSADPL